MNTLRLLITTTSVCLLAVAAIPTMADVVVPDEWFGVWQLDIASYDCDTNELLFSSTNLDTLCAESVFEDPDPGSVQATCTNSANATSYTIHCEGSEPVPGFPACTANFVYDATGTRSGDGYTAISTSTITYEGECFGIPNSCSRTEVTGTRIAGPDGPCESTPTESQTWSTVKAYYR